MQNNINTAALSVNTPHCYCWTMNTANRCAAASFDSRGVMVVVVQFSPRFWSFCSWLGTWKRLIWRRQVGFVVLISAHVANCGQKFPPSWTLVQNDDHQSMCIPDQVSVQIRWTATPRWIGTNIHATLFYLATMLLFSHACLLIHCCQEQIENMFFYFLAKSLVIRSTPTALHPPMGHSGSRLSKGSPDVPFLRNIFQSDKMNNLSIMFWVYYQLDMTPNEGWAWSLRLSSEILFGHY